MQHTTQNITAQHMKSSPANYVSRVVLVPQEFTFGNCSYNGTFYKLFPNSIACLFTQQISSRETSTLAVIVHVLER